jgi:predicted DNA-binding transcriptional regulator AlpA
MVEAMNSLAQSQADTGAVVATPVLLSPADAARYLGLTKASFYRLAKPELTPVRITKKIVRYRVADLDNWAARQGEVIAS